MILGSLLVTFRQKHPCFWVASGWLVLWVAQLTVTPIVALLHRYEKNSIAYDAVCLCIVYGVLLLCLQEDQRKLSSVHRSCRFVERSDRLSLVPFTFPVTCCAAVARIQLQ